jgi:Domain of Unknown Function (DUF748)
MQVSKLPVLSLLSPKARRRLLWGAGLLLAYTLLGFFVLPPIIRAVAIRQLSRQLGRHVSIRSVKLNPFVLSATVRGLRIQDKDGQPFVSWDEAYVNFQFASFLVHPWVFQEVHLVKPFLRVQVNRDYTFNFSDLLTKFSTNAPPQRAPKPLALRIARLRIEGAAAALTDLTPRTPFHRSLGPIDVTLMNFRTDPDNKNPYSVSGTTDAGERFSWRGYFYLDPLRSQGDFSLDNLALSKYAPLYQDFVRFRIKDGTVGLQSTYHFEFNATNCLAWVTNTALHVNSLRVSESDTGPDLLSVPEFAIAGVSVNTQRRWAEVDAVQASGAQLSLRRDTNNEFNVLEASRPTEGGAQLGGSVLLLLKGITNAAALLLNSTNAWNATVRAVDFHDCALRLEDLTTTRTVRLNLDDIQLASRNLSNLPGSNFTTTLSLRWNTNGAVHAQLEASLTPPAATLRLALDRLELKPLDPYLEPKLDVFILGSKLSMDSTIRLHTRTNQLPEITFQGDGHLDDFSTVDGVLAEDLVKWKSVRVSGVQARLDPPQVAIKQVEIDDAYVRALIETNHTINLLTALRLSSSNAPETTRAQAKPATRPGPAPAIPPPAPAPQFVLPKVTIDAVVISNAQLHFTDRSISPSVDLSIQQAGGTIAGLSSEALGRAELALHARVEGVGPVELTGNFNLASLERGAPIPATPATNEFKITVRNVDLTPTSPYVGRFAGFRLLQGKLDMDLDYHICNRRLQSQNRIELDRFTFGDKVNSPDATKLPVRLAVAILKDRDGKIKLDVPIEGSLDDPQFRLHKVIVHALVNLLTKIVTSPFAALSAVFGGHGQDLSFQDFAPGSALIQHTDKLDALAKGLYQRPGLQLEIQGSVEPDADRDGLRRLALDQRLRAAKWMSLRRAERETVSADQVTLSPEDRLRWLKVLYAQALAKGELSTNLPASPGASARTPAQLLTELRPAQPDRGATALMEKSSPEPRPPTAAARPSHGPAPAVANPLEQALLDSINIDQSEFRILANDRAKAVREYLVQNGKVEPERIFLTESQGEAVKAQGARAFLQLR